MRERRRRKHRFIRQHSLSIASVTILGLWICLYSVASPSTHLGSFFGNAIADWSGVVVMVLTTKYLYEKGSDESRRPPKNLGIHVWERLRDHSLSIFLVITGSDGLRFMLGWTLRPNGARSSATLLPNGRRFSASCC